MEKFGWEVNNYTLGRTYLDREGESTLVNYQDEMQLMAVRDEIKDSDFYFMRWIDDNGISLLELDDLVTKNNALYKVHGTEARAAGYPFCLLEWRTNWKYLPLQIVSCMDISILDKMEAESIYHIERPLDFDVMPRSSVEKEDLILFHSPTNEALKGTNTLREISPKVEGLTTKIVTQKPYDECMDIRRNSSIVFDHFRGNEAIYGMAAVEAWYLRLPVLVGLDTAQYMFHPELRDFAIDVTEKTLFHELQSFVDNPEPYWKKGDKAREYVKKVHDPEKIAYQYKALIEMITRR